MQNTEKREYQESIRVQVDGVSTEDDARQMDVCNVGSFHAAAALCLGWLVARLESYDHRHTANSQAGAVARVVRRH